MHRTLNQRHRTSPIHPSRRQARTAGTGCREHDRLHWHYAGRVSEFLLHGKGQRFLDSGWITSGLAADFIEKWRTEHHASRERGDVRNGLVERENGDLDIIEACVEKALFDRIDCVVGVGGDRKLRGCRREEPRRSLMGEACPWIVSVCVPDTEEVASTRD
jgi:hypothetical protein